MEDVNAIASITLSQAGERMATMLLELRCAAAASVDALAPAASNGGGCGLLAPPPPPPPP
jgi:hypothetical protein